MAAPSLLKKVILAPVRFTDALLDRTITLAGGLVLCQYPQFKVLYMQRLGGHVDELSRIVKAYTAAASSLGMSLQQFIGKHLSSGAAEFRESGRIMAENVNRFQDLSSGLTAIKEAHPHLSILAFFRHCDLAIARETLKTFTPGIPLNTEALAYGMAGMVAAMTIDWAIKKSLQTLIKGLTGGGRKRNPA